MKDEKSSFFETFQSFLRLETPIFHRGVGKPQRLSETDMSKLNVYQITSRDQINKVRKNVIVGSIIKLKFHSHPLYIYHL